jgi:hypothetical protein
MSGGELIWLIILFGGAILITVKILNWVLGVMGKAIRGIVRLALPVGVGFVTISLMQSGAAEASVLVVPAGVLVGAIVENSMGV